MRKLIYIVLATAVLLVLGGAIALADKPELVEEVDVLRVLLARARLDLATQALDTAKRDAQAVSEGVRSKYKLSEADDVDLQTRAIRRAAKPKTEAHK